MYYGRKILVGWDSIPIVLSSLQDLVEATATLIRLSNDPISSLPAEFGEREVDHHVLASLDRITNLPAHLSTATAITISLGDLVERAVERDVARLIEGLVFSESATGPSNILFGKLVTAMAGESARARYKKLLDYLSETTGVARMRTALDAVVVEKGVSAAEKASRLQRIYQRCMLEIQQGKSSIENQARRFLDSAIRDLEDSKHELFNKGFSLAEIRGGFLDVEHLVNDMLEEALKDAGESVVNERAVEEQLQGINASSFRTLFGGRERLVNLVGQMQRNLQGRLQESARDAAFIVLDRLQNYCAQVGRNLDIVLNKLHKQKENKEGWAAAYRENTLDTGHPLHLIALSTPKEMKSYSEKVSVFTAQPGMRASALSETASETEQLAEFRKWQEGKIEFAVLFEGDVGNLADVATRYVEEKVRMEVGKYLLIDVLLQMDEEVLFRLLGEAMSRAASLVSYESALSSDRYECWLVIADYGNDERRRKKLVEALGKAFPWRTVQLLQSDDPTEIAIFYYVDGLPMSAIDDLRGRCLNAFLAYRQRWNQQQISLNSSSPAPSIGALNQRISVPVYSGKDAETRVLEKGIIHRLYAVKNAEVGGYSQVDQGFSQKVRRTHVE